ncbi:trigger factor [Kiritimatiellaeota bacterium B1221]|nr:trigger factor [Kiritimatiellaeota bacterium B1221]
MNVQLEELSPCRRKLNIEVPVEDITSEFDDAVSAYAQSVAIPGFRPGKAPKQMVKARFKKEILGRLRDHLLPKSYHEAIQENNLQVINIIEMDEEIEVVEGQPLSYSVTVDVRPEISLPVYKGLKLSKEREDVKDEEVDARIESLREQRADFEDVTDRPVARGDMAQIDFTSTLDGKPLEEVEPEAKGLGEGKDFWLQASDEAFIPELGLALAGLSIGDKETLKVTFPDSFVLESLRGKEVAFDVEVKGVRARKLPELDEEFFKSLGVENAEEFRKQILDSLEAEKDRAAEGKLRNAIEEMLLESTSFELPESLVGSATQQQIQQIANDMQRGGMTEEQLLEQKDQLLETAKTTAERQVKLRLILQQIAGEEEIQVSDSEFKREMTMMAYAYSMQPDELERRLKENNQLDDLRGDVVCRKVLQLIQDEAEIDGETKNTEDAAEDS